MHANGSRRDEPSTTDASHHSLAAKQNENASNGCQGKFHLATDRSRVPSRTRAGRRASVVTASPRPFRLDGSRTSQVRIRFPVGHSKAKRHARDTNPQTFGPIAGYFRVARVYTYLIWEIEAVIPC
ncbi:hypothetical protein Bpla01_11410 [Burkholderia plantarii]|nr:hypothetical protein Bpla01_11410 [Burkholderia plantarii]